MKSLLSELRDRLRARPTFRNVLVNASGETIARVAVVAVSPILTRIYPPDDFGLLAAYTSLLGFGTAAASLRYDWAIPLARDRDETKALLWLTLSLTVFVATLAGGAAMTWGDTVADWLNTPGLADYTWLLPLGILGAGSYAVWNIWAIRGEAFGLLARTKIARSLGQVVSQVGLGLAGMKPFGLLFGYFIGQSAGIGAILRRAARDYPPGHRRTSWVRVREVAGRFRRFPTYSLPASLLNLGVIYLPPLFIAGIYGAGTAGLFFFATRTIRMPLELISKSVAEVYLGEAGKTVRGGGKGLDRILLRFSSRLFAAGLLPLLVVLVAGQALFGFVFGGEWREAGLFAQILAIEALAQFTVSPISQTANLLGRQALQLLADALWVTAVIAVFVAADTVGLSARAAVVAYAAVMTVAYVLLGVMYWLVARRVAADSSAVGEER